MKNSARTSMRVWSLPLLFLLCFPQATCFTAEAAPPAPLTAAEHQLNLGQLDQAITQLKAITTATPANAEAHLLLCRAYYAEKHVDEAVSECQAATSGTLANSSTAFDWLGRALGQKASDGGPITGLRTAPKVREAFEKAVALNPRDRFSVADLGEFYANAPGLVGGGADKAHALADRSMSTFPEVAHRIHAMAAESQKDYGTAEREYRAAVAVKNQADAWVDLGYFFGRRKQLGTQLDALRHAVALDKAQGPATAESAESLIFSKQHPELAAQWFRSYLAGSAQTDDQPAFRVHYLLGKLLAKQGDNAGARTEFNKALSMAHDFEPAQKALAAL